MSISIPGLLLIFAIAMIVYERHRSGRGFGGLERHFPHRQDRRDGRSVTSEPGQQSGHDAETQRELDALRERVKVLERITVDGRDARSIADEIESLRDK